MGWYGHPSGEATHKRLAEARREKEVLEARARQEQESGATYRKTVSWPKGLSGSGR